MKIQTCFIAVALMAPSFSLLAAPQTVPPQAALGTVSVSNVRGDMDDAIHALQQKGRRLGGERIEIIALGEPGDSGKYFGSAQVFAK